MSARRPVLHALLAWGIFQTGLAQEAGAEKFSPERYDISRYEQIWKRSPFIVETVQVQTSPGLAAKYRLVGLVDAGKDSVAFLADTGVDDPAKGRIILSQSKPDRSRNLELVSVSPSSDMRKSSVMIRQGAEQATLPFDPGTLTNIGIGVQAAGAFPGAQPAGVIAQPQLSAGAAQMPITPPQPGQIIPPPPVSNSNGGQTPPTPTRRIIRPKPINVD